jgi:hypothetical protein
LTFNPYKLSDKAQTGFFILFSAALAVTVPYFYVQLIPSLFFVLLIVIFFKRAGFDKRSVWKSFLFACLGLLLAFAHVYFQTQVRVKNDAFPEIQFVDEQEGNLISKNNRDFDFGNIKNPQLNKILTSSFFQKNILPLYGTGIDILRAKGIRSPLDLSQIKTYGMILISVIVFMYGIKKKKFGLVLFSGLIFFYGVSLQTGILELSFYRGRIGWYFSMLTPILLAYFLDEFEYKEKVEYALYGVLILAYGLSFVSPPTFNRHYCPGLFDLAKEITYKTNKTIKLLTNESDIQLYSEQIQVYPLNKGSIDSFDEDYIIFEKKFCSGISDRDSKVLANDLTYQAGLTNQQSEKRKTKALFDSYKQSSRFTGYTPFWQNDYFEVWAK